MKRAKIARFYGFSDAEIQRISLARLESYWLAMTMIEADELLKQTRVAAYPHQKQAHQRKWMQQLDRDRTQYLTSHKKITMKDLAEMVKYGRRNISS